MSVASVSQREAGKCVSVWLWGAKRCDLKLQRGQPVRAEEVLSLGLCPGETCTSGLLACVRRCVYQAAPSSVCVSVSFCLVLLLGLRV